MAELEMVSKARGDFDVLLKDSIAQGMERVLGVGGTKAIMYHLDLPNLDNPKRFHDKLTSIFGVGTESLERVIVQILHEKMGVRPAPGKGTDFVTQVDQSRRRFEAEGKLNRRH